MTDLEDYIVQEPYQPTDGEKQAIKELTDKGLVASDWDSGKAQIKSFKKNLRDDMYEKQNKLCAYCRIHVPKACVPLHREHIVYKDEHPQWMFLPENLCIACHTCNEYKGTTEVLQNPQKKSYPKTSNGFKIIHPLYDKYSDHIELIGDVLYSGKTDKGRFTINTCHLYRVDLAEERVDQKMHNDKKGDIIAELVYLAARSNKYVDDGDKFLKYVRKIVTDFKKGQDNE